MADILDTMEYTDGIDPVESQNLADTTVSGDYDADNIQVLEGLEAVRKRPGMYIGSTSERGLHHLVYEIVDNAVDEALAGVCTQIQVIINPDNSITVEDNGRGIPTGINKQQGVSAVELVFCKLHAGGKFGGGGYKVSGGLHGVGASVVNALSTYLEVTIKRDGQVHYQKYERGNASCELTLLGTCGEDEHGSRITFLPDPEIFEDTKYDYNTLMQRFREMAFLNKGLKITISDLISKDTISTSSKGLRSAKIIVTDSESGETVTFTGLGSGQDAGDKAIMKATTLARYREAVSMAKGRPFCER